MDDDFFEEDDNIFDEDDALDYILYEEIEKETGKTTKNAGCLTSVIIAVSAIGCCHQGPG